jgi:flagellar biosynthetic protein FlhB
MSAEEDSDAEKSHEPTQHRLDELRKKGDIARSAELVGAAALVGFALALTLTGGALVQRLGGLGAALLGQPDRLASQLLTGSSGGPGALLAGIAMPLLPVFGLPLALIFGTALAERAFVFVPSRIAPKLSRISPMAGAHARFGKEGLVGFARNLAKGIAVMVALGVVLGPALPDLVTRFDLEAAAAGQWMVALMLRLLAVAAVLALVFGGLDYGWQWWLHRGRARMSREEVKQEMKDSDGDPHVKAQRRQRAQEIALNKMLVAVKTADVVVVNPTHYAVALKWKRSDQRPPVVVAKGVDEVAARIRERAALAGVPIYSDPPTARALHATVDIGKIIQPDHYKAVAAAVRFAETMRRRARSLSLAR